MRLPLPAKVLVSYLGVVAVGAVPTFFYLRQELSQELVRESAERLSERARRMARVLAQEPPAGRVPVMRQLSTLTPERLTLITPSGDVAFDSHVDAARLRSHAERPEVIAAKRGQAARVPGTIDLLPPEPGIGIARRISASTGQDTLYVAAGLPAETKSEVRPVLRMARTVNTIVEATDRTVAFLRNAQAVAVSLAIGLSLLAALFLVRPLVRVRSMAEKLASGDFAASAGPMGNDEIGDVARALEALGAEVRRRMAVAGAGEALLVQLVEVVEAPLVIFEISGEVLAVNGAARVLLGVEGPGAGQRVRELVDDEVFQVALRHAEEEGQPEDVCLELKDGSLLRARVFVLKRPGAAPLGLLLGPAVERSEGLLPAADTVLARPLGELLDEVRRRTSASLKEAGIEMDTPGQLPQVGVAEAGGRVAGALEATLLGCAGAFAGRPGRLSLDVKVGETRIAIELDAAPGSEVAGKVRPLLEPLGGGLDVGSGEATLWLPRA